MAPVRFFGGEEPPKALPRDARRLVAAGRCAHHRAPNRKASNAHCRARSWIDSQLMSTLSASLSSLLCFYHVSSGRLDNSTKTGSRWDTLWGITGTSCSWKPGTLELGESEDEDLQWFYYMDYMDYMEFLWWHWWRHDQNWSQPSQAASQCQDVKQPWPQGQRPKDLQFLAFGGAAQTHATLTATIFLRKNIVYTLHLHIRFSLSLDLSR